ncbi:tetratricopeptide repeat protein [Rhizobium ruizarguesonis]|uniref:adenylate/guanylate cyclase domain-containing protein n=1 Tax=Rhizobium ruizarguesonis TaxID=2081791 RepID=UPI001030B29C|nr:adenylate/guanylate cyclase domain-containing protein [Rhizobium ruizarguesonis]TAV03979.1 tetratricopeptide repeat protein [Rhizobium ruizarguesonis]TAZ93251.1 tetratricopeptide repeat protein [Rhizobium ruizarguesonis]TBA36154.1 tetratricopeptide repeat protein [Rhizobium ruizarguesonis]TBA78937.1 tetratricopeptide repeat protein [Rhizobium ruizarguesonis]TBA83719.1 tetratricopeptide repeat protein [Rhizobium ruizarguesonis]
MERRLTAILAADVVGYSSLMGNEEVGTLERLKICRSELFDPAVAEFHGRIIKLMGDGALVEFASVVDAVQCAAAIQRRMAGHDPDVPEGQKIRFRIGVNLGDVIVEDDDLYGDGVNVAARLEAMAEPGGICISGTAFDHVFHKADVGFTNLGEQRLKNIPDPVRVYRVHLDAGKAGEVAARFRRPRARTMVLSGIGIAALLIVLAALAWQFEWRNLAAPQRTSVAILPFANLSGDAKEDYVSDGITEDLITDLAKLSGVDVIARDSVFAYKGKPVVLADAARALNVRYLVEGSVRQVGEQLRINVQLVDMASGKNVWADRFDRSAADLFAIQDDLRRELVSALGIEPSATEAKRLSRVPTENLEAYDNFLRGEQAARSGKRDGLQQALAFYDKAEALDPAFAEAFAFDARTTVNIWRASFNDIMQSALARKRAYEKASIALKLDPDLSSPYAILGIMQVVDRRYEEAIASAERATALGPGDAAAQIALGYVQLFASNHAEASAAVETALRLDPDLSAIDREIAGLVFLVKGDTARAVETLERVRDDAPEVSEFRIVLAAAYARANRLAEARAAAAEGLQLLSGSETFNERSLAAWRIGYAHFRNPEDLRLITDALSQAGLPEWPFGFTADEKDRVKGAALASLVFGHTWQGQLEPGGQPAILQIAEDGSAGFRSMTRMYTARLYVDQDVLCEQSENMFGRPDCGPVYIRGDESDKFYTYTNSGKVFHFTVAE